MIKSIPSTFINSKDKLLFVIELDGSRIEVEHRRSNPKGLSIFVNGAKLIDTETADNLDLSFQGAASAHQIAVKVAKPAKVPFFFNPLAGIAIEIDRIPVQNSLADPFTVLKAGRTAIAFFAALLGLKVIAQLVGITNPNPLPTRLFASAVYLVPFAVMLTLFFVYKRNPKLALYLGTLVSLLEVADFVSGWFMYPDQFRTGAVGIIIFTGLRLSCLYALFKSIKALREL